MTIRRKLWLHSFLSLIASIILMGFIIVNMLSIQATNKDIVPVLLTIEKLEASMKSAKQSLNNAAYNMTEGNKQEVLAQIETTEKMIGELEKSLKQKEFRALLEKAKQKFAEVHNASLAALEHRDVSEARRQAMRIEGAVNDIYTL
jgi:uncharacterized protein YybS (DUF2232 family)